MNKILIALLALLITITGYAQPPIQHSNSPFTWVANILGHSHAPGKSQADATKLAVASDFHKSATSPKKKPSAVRINSQKAVSRNNPGSKTAVALGEGVPGAGTAKTPTKTSNTPTIQHINSPFASIAIGYRRILGSSIDSGDRSSGAYRLALGYYFLEHEKFGLSAELGIMNDDQVKLKMVPIKEIVPNMTLRPPIDLLFGVHGYYKRFMPFIKFGATYEQIRFDSPNIPNQDGWLPTIQAGFGWLFNDHAEMNLYYQRTFGKNVSVGPPACEKCCTYRVKDDMPSIAGIFLAFVWRLA